MLHEGYKNGLEYAEAIAYLSEKIRPYIGFAAKTMGRLSIMIYPAETVRKALEKGSESVKAMFSVDGGFIKVTSVMGDKVRHALGAPVAIIPTTYRKYSDLMFDASKPGRAWELAATSAGKQVGKVWDISGLGSSGGDMVIQFNDGYKMKIELKGERGRMGY